MNYSIPLLFSTAFGQPRMYFARDFCSSKLLPTCSSTPHPCYMLPGFPGSQGLSDLSAFHVLPLFSALQAHFSYYQCYPSLDCSQPHSPCNPHITPLAKRHLGPFPPVDPVQRCPKNKKAVEFTHTYMHSLTQVCRVKLSHLPSSARLLVQLPAE